MARVFFVLSFAAPVLSGCTQLDDARLEGRLRRMARSAYVASPGACNGVHHSVDYAKGFEEGYYDVASGGDGCPPPLPPKKYWSATYASPVGREHIEAWFQGFRDGAATAKVEGVAGYGLLHVSAEHRNSRPGPPMTVPRPPSPPTVLELLPKQDSLTKAEPTPPPEVPFSTPPPLAKPTVIETSSVKPPSSKRPPPLPEPPPLVSIEKLGSYDSNGWRKPAPTSALLVVKVEFKEPPVDPERHVSSTTSTCDDAGWRPAAKNPVR
jgi:hypothetical protein